MKFGLLLLALALICLGVFGVYFKNNQPKIPVVSQLSDLKSVSGIPGAVSTGFSKTDEQGRTLDEIKLPDGSTTWAVEIDSDR